MAAKKKPGELLEHALSMLAANDKRDAMFRRLEKLYDQTGLAQNPTSDESTNALLTQMPYSTNTIDLVCDLAAQMTLGLEVPAAKESQEAKRSADEIEAWLKAWISLNERLSARVFTADAAWYASMRSIVPMRTLFLDKLLVERDKGFEVVAVPVLLQVRDPLYLAYEEGALGIECVVEAWERPAAEIRRHYPGVLRKREADEADDTPVKWVEYWDATHRVYWADGEPVVSKGLGAVVPHGYGCVPYSFGVARATPRAKPEQRYRPLLKACEDLLHQIDLWFSVLLTAGHDSVSSAWGIFSDAYGEMQKKSIDLDAGSINYFAQADKVEPLQRANLPADFFQLGQMLMAAFQQSTFPFAVYGQVEGSQVAGYTVSLLQQSGRRPLIPIWNAIETAYEGAIRNCVTICRNKVAPLVGDDIPLMVVVNGEEVALDNKRVRRVLKLPTAKTGDDFDVFCTLSDPMPQDERANLAMALEATGGGLLSRETARKKYKIVENSPDEEDRISAETIFRQLVPLEGVKLAIERGYVPATIALPKGWALLNGQLVPEALLQASQPPPPAGPEQMPEQMQGPPPPEGLGAPDPAAMQQIAPTTPPISLDEYAGAAPPMPTPPGGPPPF